MLKALVRISQFFGWTEIPTLTPDNVANGGPEYYHLLKIIETEIRHDLNKQVAIERTLVRKSKPKKPVERLTIGALAQMRKKQYETEISGDDSSASESETESTDRVTYLLFNVLSPFELHKAEGMYR